MTPDAMANHIIGQIQGCDKPDQAINTFYSALCSYVESNMQVLYSWTATTPPPASVPDPMVLLDCKVKTSGSMAPSQATTPADACSMFSAVLNQNAAMWTVIWPSGFALTPAFIIPTIMITPSGADNMQDAWKIVCTQIIAGFKAATPATAGSHGAYTGAGAFVSIL